MYHFLRLARGSSFYQAKFPKGTAGTKVTLVTYPFTERLLPTALHRDQHAKSYLCRALDLLSPATLLKRYKMLMQLGSQNE